MNTWVGIGRLVRDPEVRYTHLKQGGRYRRRPYGKTHTR